MESAVEPQQEERSTALTEAQFEALEKKRRLEKNRQAKRKQRAALTEDQLEAHRENDRQRKRERRDAQLRKRRAALTEEQRQAMESAVERQQEERRAALMKAQFEARLKAQFEARLERNRQRKRKERAALTEAELEARREKDRQRMRERRAALTVAQREATAASMESAVEPQQGERSTAPTDAQLEARRERDRQRRRDRRAAMTEAQREARREKDRQQKRDKRDALRKERFEALAEWTRRRDMERRTELTEAEPESQLEARREQERQQNRERRAAMTKAQLEAHRLQQRKKRAALTAAENEAYLKHIRERERAKRVLIRQSQRVHAVAEQYRQRQRERCAEPPERAVRAWPAAQTDEQKVADAGQKELQRAAPGAAERNAHVGPDALVILVKPQRWQQANLTEANTSRQRRAEPVKLKNDVLEAECAADARERVFFKEKALADTVSQDSIPAVAMGISQLEDDTCSLIMECTVEELSEVQMDCFLEAKKAYEDAVVKANRLLGGAATPAVTAPAPTPAPAPAPAPAPVVTRVSSVESDDSPVPSPAASPPPPSPPASPPPPPSPSPSPPPEPVEVEPSPPPKPPPLPLAEDRPFAISNLSSEMPPPARISLRRDLAAAPSSNLTMESPASPPPAPVPTATPPPPVATSRPPPPPRRTPAPAQQRPAKGSEVPVGALRPTNTGAAEGEPTAEPEAREAREMQAQKYPALHVTVRTPYAMIPANKGQLSLRRSQLDHRVKKVLLNTPSQFTEWLIQTRLVRATQFCPVHPVTFSGQQRQLRLGMFTDSDKLAMSGGYVWVKNCCRPKFLSVHYGSLFDASRLPVPTTLPVQVLKLIYHWSCQTPLHNVLQWLKIPPGLVDDVYGLMRAVCMLKTEDTGVKLGGGGRVVQVGLVSLGTSGPDGLNKNVKVEVLGVKDEASGEIRMVGFEPRIKNRIRAVVSAVQDWVSNDTSLLLDHSISPQPFRPHFQTVSNAPQASKDINGNIMHYLRRSMPRMFQTSLVYLKPAVICQFIAEIAWREKYGRDPNTTFSNLLAHLGALTQTCEGHLIDMLRKVLLSPSMDLKRKPRKQKLATRPDSQPEFPALPPEPGSSTEKSSAAAEKSNDARSGTDSPAPAVDQAMSDGGGSESGTSSAAGPASSKSRRRPGPGARGFSRSKKRRKPGQKEQKEGAIGEDTRGCFYKLETLTSVQLPDLSEFRCWECKLPLMHPKHITGVYACKRCRYTTSCEKIYPVHQRVFHSKGVAPVFTMGQPIELEAPMYCKCGFKSDSGNRLALHLSVCEKRTASLVPFEPDAHNESSDAPGSTEGGDDPAEETETTAMEVEVEVTETKVEPEEEMVVL